MKSRRWYLPYLIPSLAVLTGVVLMQNCSPVQSGSDVAASESTNVLGISPQTDTLSTGASVQFVGAGGTAPYTFSVVNGVGTITTTGYYTAPATIITTSTTSASQATVEIEDQLGAVQTAVVTIVAGNGSGLTATFAPNPAPISTGITITPTGGTAPYTYTLINGSGSLSGNIYTTPAFNETASVQFTDANSLTGAVSIPVTSANTGITSIYVSALGSNVPGGGGCPAADQQVGTVADVGAAGIYGDQVVCAQAKTTVIGKTVLSNLYVTAGGSHVSGGLSCPSGYNQVVGQFADCESTGTCGGQQNLCAYYVSFTSGMNVVQNFYLSPEGQHVVAGVACDTGYTMIGTVADCGSPGSGEAAYCLGTQSFCVLYGN